MFGHQFPRPLLKVPESAALLSDPEDADAECQESDKHSTSTRTPISPRLKSSFWLGTGDTTLTAQLMKYLICTKECQFGNESSCNSERYSHTHELQRQQSRRGPISKPGMKPWTGPIFASSRSTDFQSIP